VGSSYNSDMARGWESKSVEEQQATANTKGELQQRLTAQQAAVKQRKEALNLSRRRVLQQLQTVQNPRHRQMLEAAISDLDAQLARMG
jgi:ADP-ribose pyrophosphatase YjhB (NUDIX family)